MNECNKIEQMILDGSIETDIAYELSSEIEEHIKSCESCKNFVNEIRSASNALKSADKLTVSDSFDKQLQMKLDKHKTQTSITAKPNVSIFTRMTYYVAGIAAVLLGFFYISNTGVINEKGIDLDQKMNMVSAVEESSVIQEDSLETLKENIVNDEDLRNTVSTDE